LKIFISNQILVTSALAYWVAGYAFAFGGSSNAILGTRFWASERFGANDYHPNVENYTNSNNVYKLNTQDPYIHFFYNYMLAFLVTNIAASAFAERCQVIVYVLFSIIMSGKFINQYYICTRHEWDQSVLVPIPARKIFRSRSRCRREKTFGAGPSQKKFCSRSPVKTKIWSRSRSEKNLVVGPSQKNVGPGPVSVPVREDQDHFAHL
jgi:hypothetical protein